MWRRIVRKVNDDPRQSGVKLAKEVENYYGIIHAETTEQPLSKTEWLVRQSG